MLSELLRRLDIRVGLSGESSRGLLSRLLTAVNIVFQLFVALDEERHTCLGMQTSKQPS